MIPSPEPAGDPFGPRASILRIGVCEPLPNDHWYITNWHFDGRGDPRLASSPCPYVHDEEGRHIGVCGWLFTELKALSDAQIELASIETTVPPT